MEKMYLVQYLNYQVVTLRGWGGLNLLLTILLSIHFTELVVLIIWDVCGMLYIYI